MSATRWYLKRETLMGKESVVLVVEQVAPPHYGFQMTVTSRQDAREWLQRMQPHALVAAPRTPARFYDPAEDDDGPRG